MSAELKSETIENLKHQHTPQPTQKSPEFKNNESLSRVNVILKDFPSRGLAYPSGAEIQYRPYTLGEIQRINESKNLSIKQRFEEILRGVECNFDESQLTLGDVLYIGLLRKISTLGSSKLTLVHNCKKCKQLSKHVIESKDLEFDDILSEYSDEEAGLPVVGEFSFGELEFNPITVPQYLKLVEMGKETDTLAFTAMSSNLPFEEAYKKIESTMDIEDAISIDAIDKMLFHGAKPIEFNCSNKLSNGETCDNPISVELDGGQALILPFRERKVDTKSRIRVGKKN